MGKKKTPKPKVVRKKSVPKDEKDPAYRDSRDHEDEDEDVEIDDEVDEVELETENETEEESF